MHAPDWRPDDLGAWRQFNFFFSPARRAVVFSVRRVFRRARSRTVTAAAAAALLHTPAGRALINSRARPPRPRLARARRPLRRPDNRAVPRPPVRAHPVGRYLVVGQKRDCPPPPPSDRLTARTQNKPRIAPPGPRNRLPDTFCAPDKDNWAPRLNFARLLKPGRIIITTTIIIIIVSRRYSNAHRYNNII